MRPPFAVEPEKGQESVWDYPRPPALIQDGRDLQVYLNFVKIAQTRTAFKVVETASPPTFYIPEEDVDTRVLDKSSSTSLCEWKGRAEYFNFVVDSVIVNNVAWRYTEPKKNFIKIKNYFAFYPSKLQCYINGERVKSQAGGFYGGWITNEIVGPFKGDDPTSGW